MSDMFSTAIVPATIGQGEVVIHGPNGFYDKKYKETDDEFHQFALHVRTVDEAIAGTVELADAIAALLSRAYAMGVYEA